MSEPDRPILENFIPAAVVFDLDGLMVDTEPLARVAWNRVLAQYGKELDDNLFEQMIGLRLEDSTNLVIKALDLAVDPVELSQNEQSNFRDLMESGLKTMPGLSTLLSCLDHHSLPWAVATSSGLAYARKVLAMIELLNDCQFIASGEEVTRGKPHPDIYLLASSRLGLAPDKCLALEDSVTGCQAANSAGMITIAIPSPLIKKADYSCADIICPALDAVVPQIDKFMESDFTEL
jgi:HAD superfamily hydrolase (TIGR01509 family)